VLPDVALGQELNDALASVAPVVTLPLSSAAIKSAASAGRKRRRSDDGGGGNGGIAALLAAAAPAVPSALRDALRLAGSLAHDHLGVPLPAWMGGDGGAEDEDEQAEEHSVAPSPSFGWSVGPGSERRWLAVAADPRGAAGVAGGVAVPAASGAVLVFDVPPASLMAPSGGDGGAGRRTRRAAAAAAAPTASPPPPLSSPHVVLVHELQRRAACVAWRPGQPNHLAVGCAGGVALWTLAADGVMAGGNRSSPPSPAALGPGASAAACTFLRHRRRARVTALAWSPDGRLLAGGSVSSAAVAVWEATGAGGRAGARLRAGLSAGVTRLAWSPCGRYLFAAGGGGGGECGGASSSPSASLAGALASALKPPGRFYLWETGRWRQAAWDVPGGGRVVAAAWAGGGGGGGGRGAAAAFSSASGPVPPLLLATSHTSSLVAMYLVGGPGTLAEQLLPVALPGVSDLRGGGGGKGPEGGCIADVAWDPTARRLAVALRAPHPAAGCVALYATRASPVVSAQLVGFLRPFDEDQDGKSRRVGAGLRVAFAPRPLFGGGGGSGVPSAAGGAPAAVLSVRDLSADGGDQRVANIALHF